MRTNPVLSSTMAHMERNQGILDDIVVALFERADSNRKKEVIAFISQFPRSWDDALVPVMKALTENRGDYSSMFDGECERALVTRHEQLHNLTIDDGLEGFLKLLSLSARLNLGLIKNVFWEANDILTRFLNFLRGFPSHVNIEEHDKKVASMASEVLPPCLSQLITKYQSWEPFDHRLLLPLRLKVPSHFTPNAACFAPTVTG